MLADFISIFNLETYMDASDRRNDRDIADDADHI